MRNKKGEVAINLPWWLWLILAAIILIGGFVFFTYNEYSDQKDAGNLLLENITLSGGYEQLTGANTITNISATLNGTDINEKVSVKTFFYINGEGIGFYGEETLDKIQFPYKIKKKEIDTKDYYNKYGNNFEICTEVEVRYKNLNFWRFVFGSSLKELEKCQIFSGTIEEK